MYKVGDKILFAEEKRPYTIRACDERFLVCTKPFNLIPKTVQYTIVDLEEEIRGTDGYAIGPYDYYEDADCESILKELQEWVRGAKTEIVDGKEVIIEPFYGGISRRNRIDLKIISNEKRKD